MGVESHAIDWGVVSYFSSFSFCAIITYPIMETIFLKGENEMNVKEFWRKNKKRIFIVGGTIVAGTVVFLISKESVQWLNTKGKRGIWWKDEDNSFMDIERVKEILEANKDNSSKFAIFREGPNPNEYVTILLSDDVVIP